MASVFTQIMQGDLSGHFVWEDDLCVGLMTIMPIRAGHVLLIPREEIDHWDELPTETLQHMMAVSQKISQALKASYPCARVGVMIAGLEVPHTHIHLMPIDSMADMDFANAAMSEGDELAEQAARIKAVL